MLSYKGLHWQCKCVIIDQQYYYGDTKIAVKDVLDHVDLDLESQTYINKKNVSYISSVIFAMGNFIVFIISVVNHSCVYWISLEYK
jgi:hypothetical protein